LNLRQQHADIKDELLAVVEQALDQAAFVGGKVVEQFEQEFARFTGARHCVGVASGTDALRFALLAVGVGPGTSVITVPNTFIATAASITQTGGAIEFVDVDPATGLMDPGALEDHLKRRFAGGQHGCRPVAVLPVHLYGQCADMDSITAIARRYGLKVVEDAAQAQGSLYRGRPAGSLADVAAFSFYPGKNLGACGEAGAVTTSDEAIERHVLLLRDHGRSGKYVHVIEGYNGRLDAMQAGLLSVKLKHLPRWNEMRRQRAARYSMAFAPLDAARPVEVLPRGTSIYHLYVIRTLQRERLQTFLHERRIATGVHYPLALHLQPCYQRLGLKAGSYPHAERWCAEVLSLPLFPELTEAQQQRVIDAVLQFTDSVGLKKVA
jgi:dTDP-4-amino-4,6-dideoxygalactose transaminase